MPKKTPADNNRYEVITQEDPETGDLLIPIPEPILRKLGWKEGDEINIDIDHNGNIILKK